MDIGKNIEFIRKKIGYSRKYIAENICDESTIYRIEKGLQIPRLDILQKICHKLHVSVDYILSLDDENTSYVYINKLKKLCREFLYKKEFQSIQYIIEEAEIYIKSNPNIYDNDFRRFIEWQKAILVHTINKHPKKAKTLLSKLLTNKVINELDINIANSLALVLMELDKNQDAYYLLNEGLRVLNKLPIIEDTSLYPRISYNLTYIHYNWGEYDKCINICHRLEYYLISNHLLYSMGELYHLIGITYEKKNELESSYHYFKKATSIFLFEDKTAYYIRTSLALSEVCFQMNNSEEGNEELELVMEKTNGLDDSNLIEHFTNKVQIIKKQYSAPYHN